MAKKIYLSVVIPAYNEAQNIKEGALEQVLNYLKKQKYSWEVLIVDDGSLDDTPKLVKKWAESHPGFKLLQEPHRGKAGTVIAGMLQASGENVLFTDMDQATPLKELDKLLPKISKYDIVIGSRSGRKGAPLVRKIMAFGFVVLRTIILRLPYQDTQCGFKLFTKKANEEVFSALKRFQKDKAIKGYTVTAGFDLELLYLARKLGFSVGEEKVKWQDNGKGQVNPIKDSWIGFKGLINVRMNALQGKYKLS